MKLSLLIRRVTNQIKLTVYTTFPRNHSPTITPSLKGASESPTKQHEIVLKVADRNHFLWKQIGFLFFFTSKKRGSISQNSPCLSKKQGR